MREIGTNLWYESLEVEPGVDVTGQNQYGRHADHCQRLSSDRQRLYQPDDPSNECVAAGAADAKSH